MKKLFVLFLMVIIFASCSKNKPGYGYKLIYSCDPEINEVVFKNLTAIQTMDREQWLQTDNEYKLAYYKAFTSKQKESIWSEKKSELMKLKWSEQEIAHIKLAFSVMETTPDFYESRWRSEEDKDCGLFFQFTCDGLCKGLWV